jgi:hypothetical protein
LKDWTVKLNEITPEIIKFILSKKDEDEEFENILRKLVKIKIWKTDKITAKYKLKDEIAEDDVESYLDLNSNALYVYSDENTELPDLIGNAYEEHFSKYKINGLREFIKDIINAKNKEKLLSKYHKRQGIDFNIDVNKYLESEEDENENIKGNVDNLDNSQTNKSVESDAPKHDNSGSSDLDNISTLDDENKTFNEIELSSENNDLIHDDSLKDGDKYEHISDVESNEKIIIGSEGQLFSPETETIENHEKKLVGGRTTTEDYSLTDNGSKNEARQKKQTTGLNTASENLREHTGHVIGKKTSGSTGKEKQSSSHICSGNDDEYGKGFVFKTLYSPK